MLKYALLGFLNYQPMSGYALKGCMDSSTAHFWHAKLSQVYTTLKTLEAEGLVVSSIEEQTDRPDKRVFTITDAGWTDLQGWLAQPTTELSPKKETIVLKLFFSAQLERQTILTGLRIQRELHKRQAAYFRDVTPQAIREAADMPSTAKDVLLWEATRRFGEEYEVLYVRWLEECIELIETKF